MGVLEMVMSWMLACFMSAAITVSARVTVRSTSIFMALSLCFRTFAPGTFTSAGPSILTASTRRFRSEYFISLTLPSHTMRPWLITMARRQIFSMSPAS